MWSQTTVNTESTKESHFIQVKEVKCFVAYRVQEHNNASQTMKKKGEKKEQKEQKENKTNSLLNMYITRI